MKTYYKITFVLALVLSVLYACDEDDYKLETEFTSLGEILTPVTDTQLALDVENGSDVEFTWTQATSKDGGLVIYEVLFDTEGGDFSNPISSFLSEGNGVQNRLELQQVYLNIAASNAGIQQLESGNIIWTVRASSAFNQALFNGQGVLNITRPEGLAVFPEYMYIYGPATERASLSDGVAFKQISNNFSYDDIPPGVFESITYLNSGEFFIANTNDPDDPDLKNFYINEEGKIRQGNVASSFDLDEGVYRIRMNLALSTISYERIETMELYIIANQLTKATFQYVGNHTFESTNGYYDFLTPGAPEAPSWLGWEEERYRFRFTLNGNTSYLGSYHNEDMNGSLVAGYEAFNQRPNGSQPDYYFNSFFLGQDPGYWQGAYKFPDAYNGHAFTCRIVFDPMAEAYYHEFTLN